MTSRPQLCLGTVQFGLSYGITNQAGQVSEAEASKILNLAVASGIDMFDTTRPMARLKQSWDAVGQPTHVV